MVFIRDVPKLLRYFLRGPFNELLASSVLLLLSRAGRATRSHSRPPNGPRSPRRAAPAASRAAGPCAAADAAAALPAPARGSPWGSASPLPEPLFFIIFGLFSPSHPRCFWRCLTPGMPIGGGSPGSPPPPLAASAPVRGSPGRALRRCGSGSAGTGSAQEVTSTFPPPPPSPPPRSLPPPAPPAARRRRRQRSAVGAAPTAGPAGPLRRHRGKRSVSDARSAAGPGRPGGCRRGADKGRRCALPGDGAARSGWGRRVVPPAATASPRSGLGMSAFVPSGLTRPRGERGAPRRSRPGGAWGGGMCVRRDGRLRDAEPDVRGWAALQSLASGRRAVLTRSEPSAFATGIISCERINTCILFSGPRVLLRGAETRVPPSSVQNSPGSESHGGRSPGQPWLSIPAEMLSSSAGASAHFPPCRASDFTPGMCKVAQGSRRGAQAGPRVGLQRPTLLRWDTAAPWCVKCPGSGVVLESL